MAKLLSNTFYWFSDSLVKGWLALFMRETAAIQSHLEWTFFLTKATQNWNIELSQNYINHILDH